MTRPRAVIRLSATALATGSLVAGGLAGTAAVAAPSERACDVRPNRTYDQLLECVRLEGVKEHLAAFQSIADANGGNRAVQTTGYDESVEYVVDVLTEAGWDAEVVPFEYQGADIILQQLTPTAASFPANPATGTAEGDLPAAAVVPVDVNLTGDRQNTSGCEATDFAAFPAGAIALVQRGTCPFALKAQNAQAAGAGGVIIFNQGDTIGAGDRFGAVNPTLAPFVATIPVVGTSFAAGESLAAAGSTAQLRVDFLTLTEENVIAELPGRNDSNVVMAGAHLDSVPAGPGINDNGSGSAALLEIAQNMSRLRPQNTVRFAWWGAEEIGLVGSTAYVNALSQAERDRIALYLNFDMVGSPNYVFQVYDADESSFPAPAGVPIPEGSEAIEKVFESFYTLRGEPYDDSQFSGRSDYQAFINNGIPSSGLFTGAEQVKTEEQEAIWGGTAGEQFDPCYHEVCDTFANLDDHALEVNSDAIAFAVLTYAASTETVNGVPGGRVQGSFEIPAPAGPEFTFIEGEAGGLDPDHHDHDHEAVVS